MRWALPIIASGCSLLIPFDDYSNGSDPDVSGATSSTSVSAGSAGSGGACGGSACAPSVVASNVGVPSDIAAGDSKVAWLADQKLFTIAGSPAPMEVPVEHPHEGPIESLGFDGLGFVVVEYRKMIHDIEHVDLASTTWTEIGFAGDPVTDLTCKTGIVALHQVKQDVVICVTTGSCLPFTGNWSEPAKPSDLQSMGPLALSATDVFVVDPMGALLKRCVLPDGPCTDFATNQGKPAFVAAEGSHVVWTNLDGAVRYCPVTGCANGPVKLADRGAGAGITAIAIVGSAAYWIESSAGNIVRCSVPGCPEGPTVIASNLDQPTVMAIDDHALFFVESGQSRILKVVLPP